MRRLMVFTMLFSIFFPLICFAQSEIAEGIHLYEDGQYAEAVTVLKKAVRNDRKNAEAFYHLARAYRLENTNLARQKAFEYYERATLLESDNIGYLLEFAEFCSDMRKFWKHDELLKKALSVDSASVQASI